MARMNLFNSSCQADEVCMVYCKAHANLHLNCKNAVLVRLRTTTDREHIVWMDGSLADSGIYSYARAFYEPQEWADDDLGDVKYRTPIQPDKDVFCYNGNTYFLYAAQNKNFQIRRLKAYCSQTVVEKVERQTYENKTPEAVFISNFYTFDGKQQNYALTCWGISYENETNYLPVFDEDHHYLEEYELSHFARRELDVGEIFKNNDFYYQVQKGPDGKIELEQAKSPFLLGKSQILPTEKPSGRAKIISINFKKQSGG